MFSKEKINSKRQVEIDIVKGLAILFMINVHVLWLFSDLDVYETIFGGLVYFAGGPLAAPVFMFAMGIGIVYSRNNNYQYFLKRGLFLLLLGYVLNIFRFLIPFTLALEFNIIQAVEMENSMYFSSLLKHFLSIDILQFAGLALIVIAFLKKIKLPVIFYPVLGLVFQLANYFLQDIQFNNIILNSLAGLLWGSGFNSYFPLLVWMFYPLLGVFFANFLIRSSNKKRLYLITFFISILLFIISGPFASDGGMAETYNYYHHGIFENLLFGGMLAFWVSLIYFTKKIIPFFLIEKLKFMSINITKIYIIHWIIIGWSVLFLGLNNLPLWPSVLGMLVLIIMTYVLTYLYNQKFDFQVKNLIKKG